MLLLSLCFAALAGHPWGQPVPLTGDDLPLVTVKRTGPPDNRRAQILTARGLDQWQVQRQQACADDPGCDAAMFRHVATDPQAMLHDAQGLFDGFEKTDLVLFDQGRVLWALGQHAASVDVFKGLVREHSDSAHLSDAYLYIADHYEFVVRNAFGSIKAYQAASLGREGVRKHYALYRLAWALYRAGEGNKAVEVLHALRALDDLRPIVLPNHEPVDLRSEALQDLAYFYIAEGSWLEGMAAFSDMGERDVFLDLFLKHHGYGGCKPVIPRFYGRLLQDAPLDRHNVDLHLGIIAWWRQNNDTKRSFDAIERLGAETGPDSAWAQVHAHEPALVRRARAAYEAELRGLAELLRARKGAGAASEEAERVTQRLGAAFPPGR